MRMTLTSTIASRHVPTLAYSRQRTAHAPESKAVVLPPVLPPVLRPALPPALRDTEARKPADPAAQARCRIVLAVVEAILDLVGDRPLERRDRRRMMTHVRQIAMYLSHVVLQISLTDIGIVFGRDRTTVGHACHVVEDRRDDTDFDGFLTGIERVLTAVFGTAPRQDERAAAPVDGEGQADA
jgi:hypothetical protein